MGPFPFIRFEQAEINGSYGDEYAYRKTQIQVLNALFVDNYFNGDKFFIAVNEIRNEIQLLNNAPTFASLELILPSPYPSSVGVEVYTLKIGIQQNVICYTSITFNLTDGIVTASDTVFTAGPDVIESAAYRPFIAEELKLAKTLSVYQQNGAAIFPDTFTFDSTTGIAERRLLRAYDWKYNTASNQPQRDSVTDLRLIPKTVFRLRELTQIEKSMVSFFLEKPIKESLTNDNWNVTNIYLPSLPDDWQFDFITVSSTIKQLSISSTQYGLSFVLAGIVVSGKWYFQRFVNPNYTTGSPPDLASPLGPANPKQFQWNIAINSNTGIYGTVLDIMSLIDNNVSDIILYGGDEQYVGETLLITIPFASLDVSTSSYLFADSIETYLNANGFPTTYTTETISGQIVFKFVTAASILETAIIAFLSFDNSPFSYAEPPGLLSILPANPDTGKLYETVYYDFDQCEFGTVVNEEPFNLTIKSGDSYQINIPSNFIFEPEIGPDSDQFPKIGIFDCNIGQFKKPDCSLFMIRVIEIPDYEYNNVIDGTTDVFVNGIDLLGNVIGAVVSVPIADIDTTTINTWASSFCNAVTLIDSDVLVTFEFVSGKLILTFTINYTVTGLSYLRLQDAVDSYIINGIAASLPCIYRGGTIIGQLKSPYNKTLQWNIAWDSTTEDYYGIYTLMANIDAGNHVITLSAANDQNEQIYALIIIPNANLDTSGTDIEFADSIANYLTTNGFPTTWDSFEIESTVIRFFTTVPYILENALVAVISVPEKISLPTIAPPATQYQASITIPPLPNGIYYIGIFQSYIEGGTKSIELEINFFNNIGPRNPRVGDGFTYQIIEGGSPIIYNGGLTEVDIEYVLPGDEDLPNKKLGVTPFQWNIANSIGTGLYEPILDWMTYIESSFADIKIFSSDVQYVKLVELITIPYASLNATSTVSVFADSIADYLTTNGYITTWSSTTISGEEVIQFFTILPELTTVVNGLIALTYNNVDPLDIQSISFGFYNSRQLQITKTLSVLQTYFYYPITGSPEITYTQDGNSIVVNYTSTQILSVPTPSTTGINITNSTTPIPENNYSSLLAMSQPLQLDNFEDFTQILEYGANENSIIEGFEYINGWLQKIRVPLNGAGQTANSEESIYRNSDGTFQKPENSTDEVLYLHTDYLDLATQRAMISATKNPIFVLAGQNLSVQGDLEITNNQDFTQNSSYRKLQQMKFQALTQGYQPDNNSCIG